MSSKSYQLADSRVCGRVQWSLQRGYGFQKSSDLDSSHLGFKLDTNLHVYRESSVVCRGEGVAILASGGGGLSSAPDLYAIA